MDDDTRLKVERIRLRIKREYKLLQGSKVPQLAVTPLERILELYIELYKLEPPSLSDKAGFNLLKVQYKTVCALSGSQSKSFPLP